MLLKTATLVFPFVDLVAKRLADLNPVQLLIMFSLNILSRLSISSLE